MHKWILWKSWEKKPSLLTLTMLCYCGKAYIAFLGYVIRYIVNSNGPGLEPVDHTRPTYRRRGWPRGVWCTKFQSSLMNFYFRFSSPQSSLLVIHFRDGLPRCSHCTKVWHRNYPICDAPLLRSASPHRNSGRHRSCV